MHTGTGKGGKSIWGGKFADEVCESLKFNQRGQLAMANNGPNTNRSQFFITYAKQPNLNGKHTIFGRVIHGWDTLDAMERSAHGEDSVTLRCITIHANPLASLGQLSSQ
jgi:peptidyl-prolyl cis-trans isomerase-like 3